MAPGSRRFFGACTRQIAVGDFELTVSSTSVLHYAVSASVLLGNGDGTFQAATSYPTATMPAALTAGDFNRDGILDLAVVDWTANSVSILLGKGGTPTSRPTSTTRWADVIEPDFNGDGHSIWPCELVNDRLSGHGDGTSTQVTTCGYLAGPAPAVAYFTGDGIPDLAVVNHSQCRRQRRACSAWADAPSWRCRALPRLYGTSWPVTSTATASEHLAWLYASGTRLFLNAATAMA